MNMGKALLRRLASRDCPRKDGLDEVVHYAPRMYSTQEHERSPSGNEFIRDKNAENATKRERR